jgi:hypothetical protein
MSCRRMNSTAVSELRNFLRNLLFGCRRQTNKRNPWLVQNKLGLASRRIRINPRRGIGNAEVEDRNVRLANAIVLAVVSPSLARPSRGIGIAAYPDMFKRGILGLGLWRALGSTCCHRALPMRELSASLLLISYRFSKKRIHCHSRELVQQPCSRDAGESALGIQTHPRWQDPAN